MIGAALLAKKAVEARPDPQALGQDHPGARLEGRHRLLRPGRADALPREARVQPRRLRLHHLYRQLGPADPRGQRRRCSYHDLAVTSVLSGNRNFEGRINPDVKMNYLASPPLVVAYALAGSMDIDITTEPLGIGADGQPVHLADIWPSPQEIQETIDALDAVPDVHRRSTPRCSRATSAGSRCRPPTATPSTGTTDSTYIRKPTFFDGMPARTRAGRGHRRRAGAGQARRLGDHRPHLAGGCDQARLPGGQLPHRARRRGARLQLLRLAARQPRGHDPRHLRQHPPAQPARAGHRGRLHPRLQPGRRRRGHLDLRGVRALPGRGHPAGGPGGRRVRLGVVARLGRQGHRAARRRGGHRRQLRAHPPLQPHRHGRPAAAVPRRGDGRVARPDRRGDLRHHAASPASTTGRSRRPSR